LNVKVFVWKILNWIFGHEIVLTVKDLSSNDVFLHN
jgi:hypothetical protein